MFACVLLDEVGVKADMIKSYLHWMGDSYCLYLCDTAQINAQHNQALTKTSAKVMELLAYNIDNSLVGEDHKADNSIGEYVEFDGTNLCQLLNVSLCILVFQTTSSRS